MWESGMSMSITDFYKKRCLFSIPRRRSGLAPFSIRDFNFEFANNGFEEPKFLCESNEFPDLWSAISNFQILTSDSVTRRTRRVRTSFFFHNFANCFHEHFFAQTGVCFLERFLSTSVVFFLKCSSVNVYVCVYVLPSPEWLYFEFCLPRVQLTRASSFSDNVRVCRRLLP